MGATEEYREVFPFLLVEQAVLIQVHAVKPIEHFLVVNLRLCQFAIMVLIPLGEGRGPGIEHQPLSGIAAGRPGGHVDHRAGSDGCGNHDPRQPVDPPQTLAASRIVGAELQGAGNDDFGSAILCPHDRCRITADGVRSGGFPEEASGGTIEGRYEAVNVVVLVENNFALEDNGRAAGAILVPEGPHALLPELVSLQVVAKQTCTAEEDEQALAVASDRRGRGAPNRVGLFDAFGDQRVSPKQSPGRPVERDRRQFF